MRIRSSLATTTAVAAAVLLSACSGGPGGDSTPSPTPTANAAAAMRAVSQCMRTHGYPNFPDPVQDAEGHWGFPPSTDHMKVTGPCDQTVRQAKAATKDQDREKVTAATLGKLREYSRCMREHGLADWPDPTPQGTFKLPPRLRPPAGAQGKTRTPFQTQDEACRHILPTGVGVRVDG